MASALAEMIVEVAKRGTFRGRKKLGKKVNCG
jgi:hypothetical protein